jgi:hypothetical protein
MESPTTNHHQDATNTPQLVVYGMIGTMPHINLSSSTSRFDFKRDHLETRHRMKN